MDLLSFALVMLAAVMHAGWNLFVKKDDDKFLSLTMMAATSGVLCAIPLAFMPGISLTAWKILAVSAPLHAGYRVCLSLGYKYGEMSQVYPIARGATPLLVSLISICVLGVHLRPFEVAGIIVIGLGIIGLTFYRGFPREHEGRAIAFALGTAAFIAVFTLLDSAGSRQSGSPGSYILWLFVLEGAAMLLIACAAKPRELAAYVARNWATSTRNGLVMSAAYGLVVLALSRSQAPIVSALRETSVVFGIFFSSYILKERIGPVRLTCTLAVMAGLILTTIG